MSDSQFGSRMPASRPDVHLEDFTSELIVYDGARKRVHALNPTARLIWQHCDGQKSIADVADVLLDTYAGVTRDQAETDIRKTLENFEAEGLLQNALPQTGAQ